MQWEIVGSLLKSHNSLRIKQHNLGRGYILGTRIQTMVRDGIKVGENVFVLTPEKHKVLSSTGYRGDRMRNDSDVLMYYNSVNEIG